MCLEDCVSASVGGSIIDATVEELEAFSDANHVKTQILPPAVIGYGNSNVGAKVEATFHSCKLDVGGSGERLQAYSQSCIGFCSDFGTESGLMDVPALNISDLLSSTWCRSRLLSKPLQLFPEDRNIVPMDGQDDQGQNCNFQFNLQQSLFVPGMKHILDNLTGDLLARLEHFESFQDSAPCPDLRLET